MAGIRVILAVAGKDLLRLRRDRFGLAFALGFPVAFAVAFFFMLGPGLSETADDAPPPTIALTTPPSTPAGEGSAAPHGTTRRWFRTRRRDAATASG